MAETHASTVRLKELAGIRLEQLMSEISEDHYAAGWMGGLEFDLWAMVRGGDRDYGMGTVSLESVAELKRLSEDCDGWFDGHSVVSLSAWRCRFAMWWEQCHVPRLREHLVFLRSAIGKDFLGRATTQEMVSRFAAKLEAAERELAVIQAEV